MLRDIPIKQKSFITIQNDAPPRRSVLQVTPGDLVLA